MTFRPYRALLYSLLAISLLLAACQQTTPPVQTAQATPGGGKPIDGTPQVDGAATLAPTFTLTPAPTATPSDVMGSDPEKLSGLEIDFWHPWQGEAARQAQEAVNEFNRTNSWKIHVRARAFYSTGSLSDALNEAQKSGAGLPDIIAAPSEQLAALAQGSAPLLVDLNDYIADGRVGLSEAEVKDFLPAFWAQDQAGDLRFGLPALREARVLFYNQGWAADLGFNAPPKTTNDFKQQACAAAQKNNTSGVVDLYGTGGLLVDADALTMLSWMSAFDAKPVPAEDGQPYLFDTDEGEAALLYLRDLIEDGCAWIARSGTAQEHFANRKAMFYTGTLSELAVQQGWQSQLASSDAWSILPFPSAEGEPLVYSGGQSYGVLKTTPDEQLSGWLFARWMAAPQIAAQLGEALPSLPVSGGAAEKLAEKRDSFPWNQILPLVDAVRPAPALASWRRARHPLEDAAWQVYHLPPDGLAEILPQLDETIYEMIKP